MIHHFATDDETEETEEINDEDATLADDLLDEVTADEEDGDAVEGFGILPETDEEEDEDGKEEKDEFGDDTEELEEDAEDVDFDTFDDIDEL